MTYKKVLPNVKQYPIMKNYKMACCDCGLVHNMSFEVVDAKTYKKVNGYKISISATRNNRATGQIRRHKK